MVQTPHKYQILFILRQRNENHKVNMKKEKEKKNSFSLKRERDNEAGLFGNRQQCTLSINISISYIN
jgi:hypothetical protein